MAPRIPEGFVFVSRKKGVNVALDLLDAAEEVGADRVTSVRSTTNGYNVLAEVAERYAENLGEEASEIVENDESEASRDAGDITTDDVIAAISDNLIDDRDAEEHDDEEEVEEEKDANGNDSTPVAPATGDDEPEEEESDEEELPPLGVTVDSTHDEIDDYASNLTPPVDVSKARNKAEKIEILEHARTAPKSDAE